MALLGVLWVFLGGWVWGCLKFFLGKPNMHEKKCKKKKTKPQPIMHKKQAKKSQQFLCVEFDELSENIHLPVRSGTHSPNAKEELPSHPNAVCEPGVSELLWPCIRPVPPEDCDVGGVLRVVLAWSHSVLQPSIS